MHGESDDRREWVDTVESLRRDGAIRVGEENALIRLYDERAERLNRDIGQLGPEYDRRVREEGEQKANQWLVAAAEELGRRDGEETTYAFSRASAP